MPTAEQFVRKYPPIEKDSAAAEAADDHLVQEARESARRARKWNKVGWLSTGVVLGGLIFGTANTILNPVVTIPVLLIGLSIGILAVVKEGKNAVRYHNNLRRLSRRPI